MVGFFNAIGRGIETKSVNIDALTWSRLWGEGASVKSGVSVNTDTAIRVATGFACGRVISEDVGSLPFKLYKDRKGGGADLVPEHSLYRLIYEQPNAWMTSMEFIELLTLHAALTGNGFAFINRGSKGQILELIPLLPSVKVCQEKDWEITYEVPQLGGQKFGSEQIFHLRGPGWTGVCGFDVVQIAREAFGLAIATEETHSRFHKNSARPSGLFAFDGKLSDDAYNRLRAQVEQNNASLANAFKTWFLDQGAKFTPITMTGVDSQHLETRRFQIEELCRFFRVMPQMVMHTDKTSTYASSESHFVAHVIYTVRTWVRRWEQSVKVQLLSGKENEGVFARMNVTALLRGDSTSRANYFKAALGSGGSPAWMTPNEIRGLEELNPLEGGDELAKPMSPQPPADGAQPQGKAFNPLQARAPAGGSDGGQWIGGDGAGDGGNSISGGGDGAGDGGRGGKPASQSPDAHVAALNSAAAAAASAMQANTYDPAVHRAAFQAAVDAADHDKTITNAQLRAIIQQVELPGTGTVLGRTREELINELRLAFTHQMRFIDKTRPSKGS